MRWATGVSDRASSGVSGDSWPVATAMSQAWMAASRAQAAAATGAGSSPWGSGVGTASSSRSIPAQAVRAAASSRPDLVLLDVMMPDGDGFEVLRRIRSGGSEVPVIFLTARDEVPDRVKGFDIGGDDYVTKPFSLDELLERPFFADPLRRHDIAPITDGAAAIVLAADDRARELRDNPAWITGIEHRIETPALGLRDLTESPSTRAATKVATGGRTDNLDVAEIHAPFTHQHLILAEAIRIPGTTKVNPSGGALAANPMFVAGLERIGFAAQHIWSESAQRVLAHATSGPALQQNLVAVMEGKN